MKIKILITAAIVMIGFSAKASQSMFSLEATQKMLEDYFSFYQEQTLELQEIGVQMTSIKEEGDKGQEDILKIKVFEKQNKLERYALALAETFSATDGEVFNSLLFELMSSYLENASKREAIYFLMPQIFATTMPQVEQSQNHRCWKSATDGAIEGFYLLTAIEIIRAVGSKSGLLRGVYDGVKGVITKIIEKEAVAASQETAIVVATEAATPTYSWLRNPYFWEKIIGRPGMDRMIRVIGAGAMLGTIHGGYEYHFVEQKLNPKLLFQMVQALAVLDLSIRVYDFKESIEGYQSFLKQENVNFEELMNRLKKDQETLKSLSDEEEHFEKTAPKFLGNIPLNTSLEETSDSQSQNMSSFLKALSEEYPQFKKIFIDSNFNQELDNVKNPQDISHVSLAPIQSFLEETALILNTVNARILQKTLEQK